MLNCKRVGRLTRSSFGERALPCRNLGDQSHQREAGIHRSWWKPHSVPVSPDLMAVCTHFPPPEEESKGLPTTHSETWIWILFLYQGLPWQLRWWRICLQCRIPCFNPRLGRTPEEGKGYPPQYSCLENSMDSLLHGLAKSRTQLSDFHSPLKEVIFLKGDL